MTYLEKKMFKASEFMKHQNIKLPTILIKNIMLILKIFLFYIKLTFLPDERKISNEERKKKSSEGDKI